jgi:DNA invertase Pin-like site-specific DNA recombinase
MSTLVGYARISTKDQLLDLQLDALNKAGCIKVFQDQTSGAKTERPGLTQVLEYLRTGDTLVVWKLDRLGRNLKHLIEVVELLGSRGIHFWVLQENINTSTASGKLFFHVFGALAEFERSLIQERTKAGLESARARGRKGGRPKKLKVGQLELLRKLSADRTNDPKTIQESLGISKTTYYRLLSKSRTL